jgi:hypothetical protein
MLLMLVIDVMILKNSHLQTRLIDYVVEQGKPSQLERQGLSTPY